jgi:hypothetical protein
MNQFKPGISTGKNTKDKYIETSGEGYGYGNYNGKYRVKYGNREVKEFNNSLDAIVFFESQDGECALWENMDLLSLKELNPNYKGA